MAYKRDYTKEYKYHGTPEQKKNRAARNKARRQMQRELGKAALKGKGGSTARSNLQVTSVHYNRSKKNKTK